MEAYKVFKALGCKWRVEIVKQIAKNKNICLCELQKEFPLDLSTLSRHINLLKKIGIIVEERQGTSKNLSISSRKVMELIKQAEKL